jgi:hypothetical protein
MQKLLLVLLLACSLFAVGCSGGEEADTSNLPPSDIKRDPSKPPNTDNPGNNAPAGAL